MAMHNNIAAHQNCILNSSELYSSPGLPHAHRQKIYYPMGFFPSSLSLLPGTGGWDAVTPPSGGEWDRNAVQRNLMKDRVWL